MSEPTVTVTAEWLMPDGTTSIVHDTIPAVWLDSDYTAVDHAESMTVLGAVELATAYVD